MLGQDPGYPDGVRTEDILGCRPQDVEIDVSIVITEGERKELEETIEFGALSISFARKILERVLEAANERR